VSVSGEFFFESAYFFEIYATKLPKGGLRVPIFSKTPFTDSYASGIMMKKIKGDSDKGDGFLK